MNTDNSNSENSNSLLFEMRVMNDIRKLTPEQRKEMMNTIQTEEQLEQEALKKNPNLHLERNMQLVLCELKELRKEMKNMKNTIQSIRSQQSYNDTSNICGIENILDLESESELCSFSEWMPFIIFVLFILFSFLGKSPTIV